MKTEQNRNPVVLSASGIHKNFHLPHEKRNSMKSAIVNMFKSIDREVDVQHALRGVSFDIREGEFFGILGRNGSGKSTLLKILAEIYQPTKGSVAVKGKLVPFIELGVGFNPELTGRENVYLNGALLGFSEKEIDSRYDDIVRFAELEDFMDQKLKNYSSGMQVRLAFSVATRAEADILLVDEILAVGDADFQRKCYEYFMSLKKSRTTVILVTHDMAAVREYCDRAILIENGKIIQEGNVNKVSDHYLRLFNQEEAEEEEVTESGERWGNRKVYMEKVGVTKDDDAGTLTMTMKTACGDEPVANAVVGFNISDAKGVLLTGFSSKIISPSTVITYKPHEQKNISITIPDVFGNGKYFIDAVVLMSNRRTVCDKWNNAATFSVLKNESYYPVEIAAELAIE